MATNTPPSYDLDEARDLIARRNDALRPDTKARKDATVALFRQLIELSAAPGFDAELGGRA
jgi:hypothetical protein